MKRTVIKQPLHPRTDVTEFFECPSASPRLHRSIRNVKKKSWKELPGVENIADDILLYRCGESEKNAARDHDRKLNSLLESLEVHPKAQ